MEFIQIILQNSELKEAKLYGAAQKAAANPEIGITIQNKAAFHVIRDCAAITINYLPHLVFGSYQNPFESLKGKFTRGAIADFVKQAEISLPLNQLLHTILTKVEKMNIVTQPKVEASKFDRIEQNHNPYGDYGLETDSPKQGASPETTTLDLLCKAFAVVDVT